MGVIIPHDWDGTLVSVTKELASSLCFPSYDVTMRSPKLATWKRVLMRTQPCWHSDLGLSASRTVRNISCPVRVVFVTTAQPKTCSTKGAHMIWELGGLVLFHL